MPFDWSSDVCSSDRKSTRLNSSHTIISYAVFCFKKQRRLPVVWHSVQSTGLCRHTARHSARVAPRIATPTPQSAAPDKTWPDSNRSSFFNDTATTEIYALSLHDALPI